jgi:hypothetical protein
VPAKATATCVGYGDGSGGMLGAGFVRAGNATASHGRTLTFEMVGIAHSAASPAGEARSGVLIRFHGVSYHWRRLYPDRHRNATENRQKVWRVGRADISPMAMPDGIAWPFAYHDSAAPVRFQVRMPSRRDNRCWIGDKSRHQAVQAESLSHVCPDGHRHAFLGCQVVRPCASSYWRGPRGDGCELSDPIQDHSVLPTRHRYLSHVEGHISGMTHHLATDLDQPVP